MNLFVLTFGLNFLLHFIINLCFLVLQLLGVLLDFNVVFTDDVLVRLHLFVVLLLSHKGFLLKFLKRLLEMAVCLVVV